MRLLLLITLLVFSNPAIAAPAPLLPAGWQVYSNTAAHLSVCYPATLFTPARELDDNDGEVFSARDGATLWANASGKTPKESLARHVDGTAHDNMNKGGRISYRLARPGWQVVSGEDGGGTIFYIKTFELDDSFIELGLTYPKALAQRYQPVVELMSRCFHPLPAAHAEPWPLCPRQDDKAGDTASQKRLLEGKLVYHDAMRQWFELKLDKPVCGQDSIQLVPNDPGSLQFAMYDGCRVRSAAPIDFAPPTGYYNLELAQWTGTVAPVGACATKPPIDEHRNAKPDPKVSAYTVDIHVQYAIGDRPIILHVESGGKELRPWQAYTSYSLTSYHILYGYCADGFVLDRVYGPPSTQPEHFDDTTASFFPDDAGARGMTDLHLRYSCIRPQARKHR